MKRENWKIFLFVDNALTKSFRIFNVKIIFYPGNCTSEIQLMDHCIIKSFEVFYKHDLVNQNIDEIDNPSSKKFQFSIAFTGRKGLENEDEEIIKDQPRKIKKNLESEITSKR
jgi:hypothetical protein